MRPDGKTQVTVEYDENNVPVRLDAIVVSTQHAADVSQEQIHEDIRRYVIDEVVDGKMIDDDTKILLILQAVLLSEDLTEIQDLQDVRLL